MRTRANEVIGSAAFAPKIAPASAIDVLEFRISNPLTSEEKCYGTYFGPSHFSFAEFLPEQNKVILYPLEEESFSAGKCQRRAGK